MKIGIMGNGVVGQAMAYAYRDMGDVYRYDTKPERCTHRLDQLYDCQIVFVCVPEYAVECSLSMLTESCNIVIKSTTPVGVTKELQQQYQRHTLIHSPEFLTERTSLNDAEHPRVNVIGIPNLGTPSKSAPDIHYDRYYSLLQRRFPRVPILIMSSDESEAVKLFLNSFFSVKVSLMNEFQELCNMMGMDWSVITNAMVTEGRITHYHTQVPGPDGQYGYGGRCLPKDISNLIGCMSRAKCNPTIMQAVQMRNVKDRAKAVKDE